MSNKKVIIVLVLLSSLIISGCTSLDYKIFDSLGFEAPDDEILEMEGYSQPNSSLTFTDCYSIELEKECLLEEDCIWWNAGISGVPSYCFTKICGDLLDEDSCNADKLNCTWEISNSCIEPSCYDFDSKISCVKSDLGYEWDPVYDSCFERSCYDFDFKNSCVNSVLNCEWDSEYDFCSGRSCYNFYSNDDCMNSDLNCEWDIEYDSCFERSCYDLKTKDGCDNSELENCLWDERFNGCYTDHCSYKFSKSECENYKDIDCEWEEGSYCYSNDLTWY